MGHCVAIQVEIRHNLASWQDVVLREATPHLLARILADRSWLSLIHAARNREWTPIDANRGGQNGQVSRQLFGHGLVTVIERVAGRENLHPDSR